jgi:hypothetical protein
MGVELVGLRDGTDVGLDKVRQLLVRLRDGTAWTDITGWAGSTGWAKSLGSDGTARPAQSGYRQISGAVFAFDDREEQRGLWCLASHFSIHNGEHREERHTV